MKELLKKMESESDEELRMSKSDDDDWSSGSKCVFGVLLIIVQILLFGVVALAFVWVLQYQNGFGWKDQPSREFFLHPVLMIIGFIFCSGQGILLYRTFRCCKRIYNKLLHTFFHVVAMPAIAIGFMATYDFHNLVFPPIPNYYSLHSWIGLAAIGLFGLQFVVGFFSFLVLLCCEESSLSYRASLVPIHQHFGLVTFLLAIAACISGLTQQAFLKFRDGYTLLPEESIVMNTMGVSLIAIGVLVTFLVRNPTYRRSTITEDYDDD